MANKRDPGVTADAARCLRHRAGSRRVRRGGAMALVLAAAATLTGCSVGIPDPSVAKAVPAPATLATPTVTPGHDSAAVAAQDMTFAAGATLAAGVPVELSDGLGGAPEWKPGSQNVAGGNEYIKADGCTVWAKARSNQGPLAVAGDDTASTAALFAYLDPSILPSYLTTDTLRWGGEADKPAPRVEVLVFQGRAPAAGRATAVYARMFSKAGSSVYVSVSCPDAASLAAARTDVAARLAVVPPSG